MVDDNAKRLNILSILSTGYRVEVPNSLADVMESDFAGCKGTKDLPAFSDTWSFSFAVADEVLGSKGDPS